MKKGRELWEWGRRRVKRKGEKYEGRGEVREVVETSKTAGDSVWQEPYYI